MEEEKLFLNNDMSLAKLSAHLGTNTVYVSQIINEVYDRGFNNFINEYRIREVRRLFSEPDSMNYTIEGIAFSVGFSTIRSFNSAFKRLTGVTPSFYLRSLKN